MFNVEVCLSQPSRLIQTAKGAVEIACLGEGPTVLSVHGGPGGCDQGLLMALPLLQAGFRVIAPSRPGYLGTPLSSGVHLEEQADLLAALLDALELPSVGVVGASAGGPPAYLLASRHPDRVQSLVVIDGVTQAYHKGEQLSAWEEAIFLSRPGIGLMDWLGRHFPGTVVSNLLKTESSLSPEALQERVSEVMHSPDKLAFVQAMMRTMSDRFQQRHEGVRNDLKQLAAISQLDLTAIRCPTLILHGEADRDVLPEDARWAHGQIEGAELHWIPAGSHLAFWIAPDAAEAQAHAVAVLQKAAEPCADLSDGRADLPS